MKVLIITLLILGLSFTAHSQIKCNCKVAMKELILKIESDYPGLEEKTQNKLLYNNFKNRMFDESKGVENNNCLALLRKYLDFFQDSHIYIKYRNPEQLNVKETMARERIKIDYNKFSTHIKNTKDNLEGIWESPDFKIGLIKAKDNSYRGFLITQETERLNLKSQKVIKFKLYDKNKADYFMQDYSLKKLTYQIYDNIILSFPDIHSVFIKKNPKQILTTKQIEKINELEGFYFKELSPKTTYIRIQSFNYPYIKRIEKLIHDNKASLENHDNLIIDVRDNGGGTGLAYQKLLPYIYTNPVRQIHQEFLVTKTLIEGLQDYLKQISEGEEHESDRIRINNNLKKYKGNEGKFINPNDNTVEMSTETIPSHSPSQIVILTNKNVGSSAEAFLLIAKQSKKVKILGKPTYGVLDYASARWFDDFKCKDYRLLLPTSRSFRLPDYPIDNVGIQPDIYLDKSVNNWVDFALSYLEN